MGRLKTVSKFHEHLVIIAEFSIETISMPIK